MASESFSNPVRFYFENPHRNSTTVPRYLTWQMAGGRRSSLGCLSRSVGPSRFSLSPLFTPWRQPRDDQLNLAVFFPLTPHTMLYVWRLTSTWKFTPSLCVWNLDMLFCFLVFVFVFKKKHCINALAVTETAPTETTTGWRAWQDSSCAMDLMGRWTEGGGGGLISQKAPPEISFQRLLTPHNIFINDRFLTG